MYVIFNTRTEEGLFLMSLLEMWAGHLSHFPL